MEKFVLPTPEFSLKLPIAGTTVKYRPFLVREEKLLLLLKESKDDKLVIDNLKKVMQLCILDDTDINKISFSDFEYLFVNMRVRSMGESVDLEVCCDSCGKMTPCSIDLNAVSEELENVPLPDRNIMLTDEIGVIVKPLELRDASAAANIAEKDQLKIVALFIDKVYTKDEVHSFLEMSPEHQTAFIDSLSMKHISDIMKVVSEFPRLKANVEYVCTHCGNESSTTIEGLENFFI